MKLTQEQEHLKAFQEIPGPQEIQGAGNVIGDLAHYQRAIHKQYGPIVKFKLDAHTTAVSTTDVIALKTCSKIFDKPEQLYHFLQPIMGDLLLLPPQEGKELRKFMIEKFSPHLVKNSFDLLVKKITDEIDGWLVDSQKNAGIIAIQKKINALSMMLTIILACDTYFPDSGKLGDAIHVVLAEGLKLQYDKSYSNKDKQNIALAYLNEVSDRFIFERENSKTINKKIFLDELLDKGKDKTERRYILNEILMGGYHTIASAICWTLYAIAKHPDVAKRVYQEIDSISADKPIQYEDLSKLKYLSSVLKETLRIYPAGPYTARKADTDLNIAGYSIPKNTTIFYPIWAVHMDEQHWSEPEKFNPDRFTSKYNHHAYLPFGFGARNCPGTNIAKLEILLTLSLVLKKLSLTEVSSFKPEIREVFVLTSANDINLKIEQRSKNINDRHAVVDKRLFIVMGALALLAWNSNHNSVSKLFFLAIIACIGYCGYQHMVKSGNVHTKLFKNHLEPASSPMSTKEVQSHTNSTEFKPAVMGSKGGY